MSSNPAHQSAFKRACAALCQRTDCAFVRRQDGTMACRACGVEGRIKGKEGMTTGYDPHEIKTSQPLKPCPFCGGDVGMLYITPHTHLAGNMRDHPGSVHIECVTCEYVMHGPDEPTLTARWNRRADVADEALAALKAMPCYGCSVSPGDTSPTAIQQARGCVTCKRSRAAVAKLEGGGV